MAAGIQARFVVDLKFSRLILEQAIWQTATDQELPIGRFGTVFPPSSGDSPMGIVPVCVKPVDLSQHIAIL